MQRLTVRLLRHNDNMRLDAEAQSLHQQTNQSSPDQPSSDQPSRDQLNSELLGSHQLGSNQPSSDQPSSVQINRDQLNSDQLSRDQMNSEQLGSDQKVPVGTEHEPSDSTPWCWCSVQILMKEPRRARGQELTRETKSEN